MSRWAPNARERLENAALDLFVENGYEETTVAQIADRAGMNRATFFRHFADKREVLFGGEDLLAGLFADAITAAPAGATLSECLHAALAATAAAMTTHQRAKAAQRLARSRLSAAGRIAFAPPPAFVVLDGPRSAASATAIRDQSRTGEALVGAIPSW